MFKGRHIVDETYIKVRGQWMYLHRAIDSVGDTVEFYFSEQRAPAVGQALLQKGAGMPWPTRARRPRSAVISSRSRRLSL